jgi:hypothetical protein
LQLKGAELVQRHRHLSVGDGRESIREPPGAIRRALECIIGGEVDLSRHRPEHRGDGGIIGARGLERLKHLVAHRLESFRRGHRSLVSEDLPVSVQGDPCLCLHVLGGRDLDP